MLLPSEHFLKIFKETNGALSVTESIAIINLAAQAPPNGLAAEFGVFKGKSAISAMYGGSFLEFHLIDTEFEKEIPTSEVSATIQSAIPTHSRTAFIIGESVDYLKSTDYGYSYVMVDSGSHQDGLPMIEAKLLEDRMIEGGIMVWHDFNSQFHEVTEAVEYLIATGKYEFININREEIIEYVNKNELEQGNNSWHHNELKNPCFVGAVKRK